MKQLILIFSLCSTLGYNQEAQEKVEPDQTFELELETEFRYFYDSPQFTAQESQFPSFALRPKYDIAWNNGHKRISAEGFFRLDKDHRRTHFDVREFFYQKVANNWEFSIGLKKVFWGVTESIHLVDIINQTDAVESFDGEEKLGQPMVQFSFITRLGVFDLFYLPYHRKRTFAGQKGRLRFPFIIAPNTIGYENNAEEWHQDFAVRYSHSFNIVDIGISHFYGTGREPYIRFENDGIVQASYPIINQTGIDLQLTHNAFLWKLESIYRSSDTQEFFAFAGGLEFTMANIKNTGIDIGLLGEYLYDERDQFALTTAQNDIFMGSRIAFNDINNTSILIGKISDLENESNIYSFEASRRIGTSWKLEAEGRIFSDISDNELILRNFKNDSFLRIKLIKYF